MPSPTPNRRIEERLHALQVELPGRRFTPRQIERYTGIEHRTVEKIEQSAVRKLRQAVRLAHPRLFHELIGERSVA